MLAAAMIVAGSSTSEAAYSYTVSEISLTPASFTVGGTTVTFDPSVLPQSAVVASNFNVSNVGAISSTAPPAFDAGSTTFTEVLKLTDTLGNTEMVSLGGTFAIVSGSTGGIVTTFSGVITPISGSGFNAAVPEPASIAMLGLGLVSAGGFAFRRRMAK
jgi:PEP-CTERM motif